MNREVDLLACVADLENALRSLEQAPYDSEDWMELVEVCEIECQGAAEREDLPEDLYTVIGQALENLDRVRGMRDNLLAGGLTRSQGHAVGYEFYELLANVANGVHHCFIGINEQVQQRAREQSSRHAQLVAVGVVSCLLAIALALLLEAHRRSRLVLAQRDAEMIRLEKLESLGLLAGGIAHDFNNLLTGLLGNVSLARSNTAADGELAEMLGDAESAGKQAMRLTQQLLTFAEGGVPVKKAVDAGEALRESVSLALRGSNVRAELQLPSDLWAFHADPGQTAQLFQNVVLNAKEAMPQGGSVRVEGHNLVVADNGQAQGPLSAGHYVQVRVVDQGRGIATQDVAKIFDPYFTTKAGGTGLGLSSAYSISRRHGGHIGIEANSGSGATFVITLPATEEKPPVRSPLPAVEQQPGSTGPGRVLIMDDEQLVCRVFQRILEYTGCRVVTTHDGESAVAAYAAAEEVGDPFAVVILDLTIAGGMGGYETLQALRQRGAEAQMVVTTGYHDNPILAHYAEHGFDAAVAKPVQPAELRKCVLNLLAT